MTRLELQGNARGYANISKTANNVHPHSPGPIHSSRVTCKFNQGGGKNSIWHREQVTNILEWKSKKKKKIVAANTSGNENIPASNDKIFFFYCVFNLRLDDKLKKNEGILSKMSMKRNQGGKQNLKKKEKKLPHERCNK